MDEAQFRSVVDEALAELPEEFTTQFKNVGIIIEDEPSEEQRRILRLRKHDRLLGMYSGVPQTVPGEEKAFLPDRIFLFRLPIIEASETVEEMKEQIKDTLYHEVGHYFGMSEKRLRELGR